VIAKSDAGQTDVPLRPKDYQRMSTVSDFLDAHLDDGLTLEMIARNAGMSVNTLQRIFRMVHNTTVFDYVRARKLHRAREALERDGASVAEAAYIAGMPAPRISRRRSGGFSGLRPKTFARAFRRCPGASDVLRGRERRPLARHPLSASSAAACTRLSPAATMRPPACGEPPSQVVTIPPAPAMIGTSGSTS